MKAGERRRLVVTVTDARGRRVRDFGLARWLGGAAPARARGTVAIALVNDTQMRRLNRAFRGVDQATDVLSFASEGRTPGFTHHRSSRKLRAPGLEFRASSLGDLAIALGVAGLQASESGHSVGIELRILALHGLLHLLGYDHETDSGTMHRLEDRLRRRARLPTGLVARARAGQVTSESGR